MFRDNFSVYFFDFTGCRFSGVNYLGFVNDIFYPYLVFGDNYVMSSGFNYVLL